MSSETMTTGEIFRTSGVCLTEDDRSKLAGWKKDAIAAADMLDLIAMDMESQPLVRMLNVNSEKREAREEHLLKTECQALGNAATRVRNYFSGDVGAGHGTVGNKINAHRGGSEKERSAKLIAETMEKAKLLAHLSLEEIRALVAKS